MKKTDEELIFLSVKDDEYFSEIIDRYEKKIDYYIQRISNLSFEERQDVLQEVFISIYENILSFEKGEKFSSGIYRIAHNKVIDYWRKNKKRESDISVESNLDFVHSRFGKNEVDDEIQRIEDKELLNKLFKTLDKKYYDVFVLRFQEDKTYDEISEILEIPKSTVATLISRGKNKIKKEYQKLINK